jgi:hypothetical protein
MADQLQLRGGTTAQTATFTGALREVTVDTDKDTLVVHDNALAGGYPLLRQDLSNLPAGTIDNADINASAAIVDTKLATIATAGKVSNSATTATDANTASAIVARDASGNFTAGTITAALTGAASSNVLKAGDTMTGALVVPLASAATPSITFTGDLNTGIYSPGADQVAISTGGTGRLFIDSSGRLLVGTSTARDKLFNGTTSTNIPQFQSERAGGGLVNRLLVTGNNGTVPANEASQLILARSYGTTLNSYTAVTSADSHLGAISFQGADGTEFVEAASIQCFTDAACGANDMPGRIVLATTADGASSPTERMRIDSVGNVGIGTTSPGHDIDLRKDAAGSTVTLRVRNDNVAADSNSALVLDTPNGVWGVRALRSGGRLAVDIGGSEKAAIDTSGRLLVGTSSAAGRADYLQIQSDSGASTNGASILLRSGKATGTITTGDILGQIRFSDSSGDIYATVKAEVDAATGSNDFPSRLVFSTTADGASSPTERLIINSSGTVLPATDNAYYLGVGSNRWIAVYAVNGTIQTSDKREKTEIQASALGIDFIKSLRPVSYKWNIGQNIVSKSDDGKTDVITPREGVRRHWGFIAQDVEESVNKAGVDFGGWLLEDKDDPDSRQALRYDQFIAPLTKALQEAIAKIETLEAEVAALKAQ